MRHICIFGESPIRMLKPEEIQLRHRDLNWLSFNERVLQEAQDPTTPLYETAKIPRHFLYESGRVFSGCGFHSCDKSKGLKKSIRKETGSQTK